MFDAPTLSQLSSVILDRLFEVRAAPLADDFAIERSKLDSLEEFTLLHRLRGKLDEQSTVQDIAAECLDHLVAGIDTTGDVLCFLMWELS
jgi:cytochrome P450